MCRPFKKKLALIIAGEASADLHGSNLVRAINNIAPGVRFQGIGGSKMEKAGVDIVVPSHEMAVVGLTEALSKLFTVAAAYRKLKYLLKTAGPDLLILIDYPEFNIMLARNAKRCGVPVLYYISPQVWAWRRGRIKKIARRVDRMAVILPFEAQIYRQSGLDTEYVGHPLLDAIPKKLEKNSEIFESDLLPDNKPILGLLPGSRDEEVRNLLPPMIRAAEMLSTGYPHLQCIIPIASTISPGMIQRIIESAKIKINVSRRDIYGTLAACDLAFVASGTATLETAIMGVPMIILYRVSPLSYWIGKRVIRVPHIGLVNLVANDKIVPELIQDDVSPGRIAEEAFAILDSGQRRKNMIEKLNEVREKLGKEGASARTAEIALEMMSVK